MRMVLSELEVMTLSSSYCRHSTEPRWPGTDCFSFRFNKSQTYTAAKQTGPKRGGGGREQEEEEEETGKAAQCKRR